MKTKAHILVVEDSSVIYKRLKMILRENYYSVEKYCPSVAEAIGFINGERPDLVLLDIDLQGEHNGIYLGNLLNKEYHIPFIYVTDLDDDQTFNQGLHTKQSDFISKKKINLNELDVNEPLVIPTKPHLDEQRLIRSIQTVLELHKKVQEPISKEGVMAYVDLPKNLTDKGADELSECPVKYSEIKILTSKIIDIDSTEIAKERFEKLKKEGRNFAKIITTDKAPFYYKGSLKEISKDLPYNFVRINRSEIINLTSDCFDGRINGSRLVIDGKTHIISDTYKKEVEKRIAYFY